MPKTGLTIIGSMVGEDFGQVLDWHVRHGLSVLDIRDEVFGKRTTELTGEEAQRAAEMIGEHGLSVHCMSTGIFNADVESGEDSFRRNHLEVLERSLEVAEALRPNLIRVHPPRVSAVRKELANAVPHVLERYPWVSQVYGEAVDLAYDACYKVTIENEVEQSLFSTPEEITDFYRALDRGEKVGFTWDVQNLWVMGVFPTMDVYLQLKPLMTYYHLKGGQSEDGTGRLRWQAALEDASWPVVEITRQVAADGSSPVVCLNPSHGELKEGYDYEHIVERDVEYIRRQVPELS